MVVELLRGVRRHFARFVKELKDGDLEKAQLGLAHSYSRSKVKFNVNRADNHIIQRYARLWRWEGVMGKGRARARQLQ